MVKAGGVGNGRCILKLTFWFQCDFYFGYNATAVITVAQVRVRLGPHSTLFSQVFYLGPAAVNGLLGHHWLPPQVLFLPHVPVPRLCYFAPPHRIKEIASVSLDHILRHISHGAYEVFSSVAQSYLTPTRTAACQVSLSITNSWSLLRLMSVESVMPYNHLILCRPLLLPSVPPSIKVFSSELILCIRWPKYCSFSFSISPSS